MTTRSSKKGVRAARGGSSSAGPARGAGDWEFWTLVGLASGALIAVLIHVAGGALGSGKAVDLNENCLFWATQGECVRNPVYMLHSCRKSCKSHGDERPSFRSRSFAAQQSEQSVLSGELNVTPAHSDEQCAEWKQHGDCEASVPFMQIHCAATCGYGASDMQKHCRHWALSGECQRSMAFMQQQCAASCARYFAAMRLVNASAAQPSGAAPQAKGASAAPSEARGAILSSGPLAAAAAGLGGGDGVRESGDGGEGAQPLDGAADVAQASGALATAAGAAAEPGSDAAAGAGRLSSAQLAERWRSLLGEAGRPVTPLCVPLVDQRPDCASLHASGHCSGKAAVETLQRCFHTCSAHRPESVLRLLRRFPDRTPAQAVPGTAPLEALGGQTTLRSLCMAGGPWRADEPPALWRRRLLSGFGPAHFTACQQRHHAMTPRVDSWVGGARHVLRLAVPGAGVGVRHVRVEHVLSTPRVRLLHDFLTDDESAALIAIAQPLLHRAPALSTHRATFQNSSVAYLPREVPMVQRVYALIAQAARVPRGHIENLNAVHYAPTEMHELHADYLDSCDLSNRFSGAKRMTTFLLYLNSLDPADPGGHTRFPRLGLSIRPERNAALVFDNHDEHGLEDERTMHAADPPQLGHKYAINAWIRTGPYVRAGGGVVLPAS